MDWIDRMRQQNPIAKYSEGWNWISFNVVPEDASLGSVLATIGESATFVNSQSTGSSTNYGAYGWYGSLAELSNTQIKGITSLVAGAVRGLSPKQVVLIDESHVSAHCYADEGILAVDCFTCGGVDPAEIADEIHLQLLDKIPSIHLVQRTELDRFVMEE